MPKLITRKDVAAGVKDRFVELYKRSIEINPSSLVGSIYNKLVDLGSAPEVEDVEVLLPDWTKLVCGGCGNDVEAVVELGEEPYYESATARVCYDCVMCAVKLFEK